MAQQIQHIRTSKYGKSFLAGSIGVREWIKKIIQKAGYEPPKIIKFREVQSIRDIKINFSKGFEICVLSVPQSFFRLPPNNQKALVLHEALHRKYPKHDWQYQTDYWRLGREMKIPDNILLQYKIGLY
jgi:hypothetical protein